MNTDSSLQFTTPKNILSGSRRYSLRSPGLFTKWPLIGLTMFLVGSLIFGVLAYQVKTKNPALLQWDTTAENTFRSIEQNIPPALGEYVVFGFFLGREILVLLGTVLAIYFFHKRFWRELMMVLWGPGLGGLLWFALSQYFNRPRPPLQMAILVIKEPSFPSGHVISAVLCYGLLAYLLVPRMPTRSWKVLTVVLLTLVTLFVGLSRLLVGGHYLSDVIAGYAVGIAWAGLVYTLAERFFPGEQNVNPSTRERSAGEESVQDLRSPGLFKKWPLLGVALILLGSVIFAGLGYDWMARGPLVQMDQSIYETLITSAKAASPNVNEFMIFGFFLGKQVILLIVTLLSIYFLYKRFWRELAMLLISSAGGSLVWNLLVNYFARPRPAEQTGLAVRSIPSFPSGHAMSALIGYGFLAYLLIPKMPSRFWKWALGIAALVVVLFDGYSRIYQGSHYLTDVLAGYALGLAWAVLIYTLIETIFMRRKV